MAAPRHLFAVILTTVLLSCIPAIFGEEVDASSPDVVESIIQDINVHVGQELLVISNGTVHLDTNALRISLTKWINRVIQDNYKGSPLVLFPLKTAANLQITLKTQQLQNLIGDKGISLSSLRSALPHGRSKRSIPSAIATIAKNIFKLILGFVNTKINTTLLNVSNDLMTLFITDESTHPLLGPAVRLSNDIVTQLAHFVLHIRSGINHAFDTVINGRNETDEAGSSPVDELEDSNSTSARAKRELDEFWLGDVVDTVSLREESDVSHNRKRRDLSTIIGEIIVVIRKVAFKLTSLLNASLKEYITTRLNKTYYGLIGKSLLSPVVKACNVIINVIFPCSTCTSLG